MAKKKLRSFSDGIAKFYKKKSAERNVKSLDDLEYLGFLFYEEDSKRQQDVEFAQQLGSTLSMKIITPDYGCMDSTRLAVIDGVAYAIIYIDRAKEQSELYFYLEEVRKLE